MDGLVRIIAVTPPAAPAVSGGGWAAFLGLVPPFSDAMVGLACLAVAGVTAIAALRWRRGLGGPSPRVIASLVAFLAICGFAQVTRSILGGADHLAAAPVLAAAACWAAAGSLRIPPGRAPSTTLAIATAPGPGPTPLLPAAAGPVGDGTSPDVQVQRLVESLRESEARVRELSEADARKNEFLAMVAHELRNPLAPIRNALRIMKQGGPDGPDQDWARVVVEHQLSQLKELIDDLLEISRVTGGKVRLDREPTDVATIVAYAVETSRPTIEAHRHRLSIALPTRSIIVDVDPNRMAQVLANLLNNAAKYTEDGGQIRLSVAREGSQVVFRVRDNGVGIPPEMLARIFDLFAQVDQSLDRSQGGLGLGLTLVRSLTEMHGGTVEALSDGPRRGSEFIVRLPAMTASRAGARPGPESGASPARAAMESPARRQIRIDARRSDPEPQRAASRGGESSTTSWAGPGAPGRRVLVVDDNTAAAQSMAMILKIEGYEVQIAYDGEAAIAAVRSFQPEAILTDIGLPGIDGLELARRIRRDPDLSAGIALLAAVTGYAEPESRRRTEEAGFDHHLVKPVDPEAVLALLASLEWRKSLVISH